MCIDFWFIRNVPSITRGEGCGIKSAHLIIIFLIGCGVGGRGLVIFNDWVLDDIKEVLL